MHNQNNGTVYGEPVPTTTTAPDSQKPGTVYGEPVPISTTGGAPGPAPGSALSHLALQVEMERLYRRVTFMEATIGSRVSGVETDMEYEAICLRCVMGVLALDTLGIMGILLWIWLH